MPELRYDSQQGTEMHNHDKSQISGLYTQENLSKRKMARTADRQELSQTLNQTEKCGLNPAQAEVQQQKLAVTRRPALPARFRPESPRVDLWA